MIMALNTFPTRSAVFYVAKAPQRGNSCVFCLNKKGGKETNVLYMVLFLHLFWVRAVLSFMQPF